MKSAAEGLAALWESAAGWSENPVALAVVGIVLVWLAVAILWGSRIMARRARAKRKPGAPESDLRPEADSDEPAVEAIPVAESKPSGVAASAATPVGAQAEKSASRADVAEAPKPPGKPTGISFSSFSSVRASGVDGPLDFPEGELVFVPIGSRTPRPEVVPKPIGTSEPGQDRSAPLDQETRNRAEDVQTAPARQAGADSEISTTADTQPLLSPTDAAVATEGELPAEVLLGSRVEPAVYQQGYNESRSSFEMFLSAQVHVQLDSTRIILPGVTGEPVINAFASVFWRGPEALFDEDLHLRADALMRQLAHNALRTDGFRPAESLRDREVAVALLHYCLWRGNVELFASLIGKLESTEQLFEELRDCSAIIFGLLGEDRMASSLHDGVHADPYLAAVQAALAAPAEREPLFNRCVALTAENQRLRDRIVWLRAARGADASLERAAIARLLREADALPATFELAVACISRGKFFLGMRLVYRLARSQRAYGRFVLEHYFSNGKVGAFLRALARLGPVKGPRTYYQAAFCLLHSGGALEDMQWYRRQGLLGELPPEAERLRFAKYIEAIERGRFVTTGIPQRYSELVALLYSYAVQERTLQEGQNRRSYVRSLVKVFRHNLASPRALFSHEPLLRYIVWGFLQLGASSPGRSLETFLRSIAGRNLAARLLLGLIEAKEEHYPEAIRYLEAAPQHPLVLHRLMQLRRSAGDLSGAEQKAARLVRFFPGEATFRYNHAVLLELTGRAYEAEQAYGRALDLDADLSVARERLSRLVELRGTAV